MNDTLHTDYPEVTLEKVTSHPGQPPKKARIMPRWPDLNLEEEEQSMHAPYPAWLLTPEGTIKASNLLAGWLWEEKYPHKLLGSNFSTIFSRNFNRIPKEKNGEFYTKKTSIMKRLQEEFGPEPYQHYMEGLKEDPDLWNIYEKGEWLHEHQWESHKEWQSVLRIRSPWKQEVDDHLEFQVTVFRLPENKGFFAIGKPHPRSPLTQESVKQQYNQAMADIDKLEYVHYLGDKKEEDDTMLTKEREPEIHHDVSGSIEPTDIVAPDAFKIILDEETDQIDPDPDETWRALLEIPELTKKLLAEKFK